MKILKDLIKTLQKEKHELIQKYDDTKQELIDSKSDLRLLREQIVRERVGSVNEGLTTTVRVNADSVDLISLSGQQKPTNSQKMTSSLSFMSSLSTSASTSVRENLIKEIEKLKEEKSLVENDLKLVLCQKEELEIERDSFKERYMKLNEFLMFDLNNNNNNCTNNSNLETNDPQKLEIDFRRLDTKQIRLNIDEIISQNKYLNESNQHLKEELEMMKNTCKKYKQLVQPGSFFIN
jgi:hypothetical protein